MNTLRKLGMTLIAVIILVAVLGTLAAVYEAWVLAIVLIYAALILSVLTTLLATRYIARHARTGEQQAKRTAQRLAARLKVAVQQENQAAHAQLRRVVGTIQEDVRSSNRAIEETIEESLAELHTKMEKLSQTVEHRSRADKSHVTATVRDGTRQVESLVQLYARYPELKMPMPNSGGWAIDAQALGHMITLIEERRPQRILELGSGTSTIWVGYLCHTIGGKLVSLDHLQNYLTLTQTAVDRHELNEQVECRLAPLEPTECDGETYQWYSAAAYSDLTDIDLVIADGPPAATGPQARYPSLPMLMDRLAPNAMIILDDAHRKDEAEIVEAWVKSFPDFEQIEHGTSRLAVLQRKHS